MSAVYFRCVQCDIPIPAAMGGFFCLRCRPPPPQLPERCPWDNWKPARDIA